MELRLISGYANKLNRLVFGEKTLAEISSHSHQIAPGTVFFHPSAIFDERDIFRITGVAPRSTLEIELKQIREHRTIHPPTIAYTINELVLCRGNFFHKRFKHGVALGKGPMMALMRVPRIEGGVLSQSWLGTRFFGHWLHDDVPLNFAAAALGQPVGIRRPMTEQQLDYSALFGVEISELPDFGVVDEIIIIDDRGQNDYKRQRLELMRGLLRSYLNLPTHKGVMLIRGNSGKARRLINEQEIANHLRRVGFKIIDPGIDHFDDIIRSVANARVVIGVQGSHMAHGLFGLAKKGTMIQLQPPFEFNNGIKEICDILGMKYGFIVGSPAVGGFHVEIAMLDALLERVSSN